MYQILHYFLKIYVTEVTRNLLSLSRGVVDCQKNSIYIYIITFTIIYMKNVFRDDLIRDDLEMVWNGIQIKVKKVLIGNIYDPPKNV